MQLRDDFVVFILSHGRPNNVHTFHTLRDNGYTGQVVFVLDNEDSTINEYKQLYEREMKTSVYVFSKDEIC